MKITGPSPRHVWRYQAAEVDRCDRCGSHYHRRADGAHGAFFCHPTPAWLAVHPEDDGKER